MDEMLARVAKDLLKARKTAKQVKGAMVYPGIMLAVAITAVTVIMVFVLPTFAPLFKAQGDRLPLLTKWLLMASAFLKGWWHLYLPALGALCFAATVLARTARGRLAIDWAKLNLPIIAPMFRQLYVSRMTNTMGTLLAAGVPLLEVIRITKAVTANTYWDRMWDDLRERVNHGQEMSPTLLQAAFIPRNISAMFNAGERAGRLPEVLERIAAFAEEELDAAIKTVTGMIEPLMIIFMGVVVGGIAASILLPIFRMSQSVH
jgi:type IV pilus assembly protein PilC